MGMTTFYLVALYFLMVIDKRQTSVNKRVSMNSYMNWKKCTNFSFLSTVIPDPTSNSTAPTDHDNLWSAPTRKRIDGRDVSSG